MTASIAVTALGIILIMSLCMFGNELYYRRRVSIIGVLLFCCFCYLAWYLHELNGDILELANQLAQYQPVKLPKGE